LPFWPVSSVSPKVSGDACLDTVALRNPLMSRA
jgi:hypothetical protein